MNSFVSYQDPFNSLLKTILASPATHAKWLNTLSYLENCGARQIARCEHPTLVKKSMIKHAAEEFRHAHYLKKQIEKLDTAPLENYSLRSLLGGMITLHYLKALDVAICRQLSQEGFSQAGIREGSYLLTTYAIEMRASELYSSYERHLKNCNSKVSVRSILLEEKGHLEEMESELNKFPNGLQYAGQACQLESTLCRRWIDELFSSMAMAPTVDKMVIDKANGLHIGIHDYRSDKGHPSFFEIF